jgi:gas vesicle protein
MGYSGLKSWLDSDMASEMVYTIEEKIVKELKKAVKVKENEFNTGGAVNVAFFLEAFVLPLGKESRAHICTEIADWTDTFDRAIEGLKNEIEVASEKNADLWEDRQKSRKEHLKRYQELLKVVKKCQASAE